MNKINKIELRLIIEKIKIKQENPKKTNKNKLKYSNLSF